MNQPTLFDPDQVSETKAAFFNTIHLEGKELKETKKRVAHQNNRILEIMKCGKAMTPFEVSEIYNRLYPPAPVTSIRRAMTCLTDEGRLKKLTDMKKEVYGKANHKWKIV